MNKILNQNNLCQNSFDVCNYVKITNFIYYKKLKLHLVTKSSLSDFRVLTTFPWTICKILLLSIIMTGVELRFKSDKIHSPPFHAVTKF